MQIYLQFAEREYLRQSQRYDQARAMQNLFAISSGRSIRELISDKFHATAAEFMNCFVLL